VRYKRVGWFLLLCAIGGLPPGAGASGDELPARDTRPAQRIVSLTPSVTEILFALGAAERVCGVSRQCDYPVAAKLKARVGDFNRPDAEALERLKPDLVLFSGYVQPEALRALREAGVRSRVLPARTVADVIAAIGELGAVTERQETARRLADELAAGIARVRARVARISRTTVPSVYMEVDGPDRLYTVGTSSFMHDALTVAGGRNVFDARQEAYFEVTGRAVVDAAPAVILIDHPFQYRGGVAKRPGWSAIPAVQDGRVYDSTDFDMILLNRPGPRLVQALEEVSRLLHPEVWHAP